MSRPTGAADTADGSGRPQEADLLRNLLRDRAYRRALVLSAAVGVPVSLAAFGFLAGLHALEEALWHHLPRSVGLDGPPWWWPLPLMVVSGLLTGLVVTRVPGHGGHVPAAGLQTGGSTPAALPGVLLAAVASLPLGAVLGPEAPLIALGGGLALLLAGIGRRPIPPRGAVLLGAAGAAAAISAIFGSPLVAAVLLIEVAGTGGPRLFAVMLPALLSSGIGALVFTGFGRWTGLETAELSVRLPFAAPVPDPGDIVWGTAIGVVVGAFLHLVSVGGRRVALFVAGRPLIRTVLCATAAGACAALYALGTGRSPAEAALSGQATLAELADDPLAWGVGALMALVLLKAVAYTLCLGSLRGGPVFPALFLGAAVGVLVSPLPGLGMVSALAAGTAAASAAVLRLPVSSVVLVVLLFGAAVPVPVVVLAAVAAFVTAELLPEGPRVSQGVTADTTAARPR